MQIRYDKDHKLVGLSLMPWPIMGPENWFNNYSIATLYGWDVISSKATVRPLFSEPPIDTKTPRLNLQNLIQDERYISLLTNDLKDYDILITRPLRIPEALASRRLLMLDPSIASTFENKADCRTLFGTSLPFPRHEIHELSELSEDELSFNNVMNGRTVCVLQGDRSSGSKGTYVIADSGSFYRAIAGLRDTKSTRIVISDFIKNADELSVQCCITKYGVFIGPLQHQVIGDPDLCNPEIPAREKFCGGYIDKSDSTSEVYVEVKKIAQIVADKLQQSGYRGIFGIDFLRSEEGKLNVLEINARQTGLTPLITGLNLPFLLLNILELGGYDYEIADSSLNLDSSGALYLIHSKINDKKHIKSLPKSGTYRVEDGQLIKESESIDLKLAKDHHFILQAYYLPGMPVIPGGRLVSLQFKGETIDKNKKVLYNETKETIRIVEESIELI